MNIIMAGDKGMMAGIEAVIYSTMMNNVNVNWYIFTMNISCIIGGNKRDFIGLDNNDEKWLKKIVQYFDSKSSLNIVDAAPAYVEYLEGNENEDSGFTPFATLRLLADVILPQIKDCLYLDCDVIVQDKLDDMYHNYLAKGSNYCAYSIPEACDWESEMVSGVLLFNLEKSRRTGFLEKARKNLFENKYRYPDQMALRDAEKPYPLPETYSYMFELHKLTYKACIIHFTNQVGGKIYVDGKALFYRKFPQFKYIDEGLELIRTIV